MNGEFKVTTTKKTTDGVTIEYTWVYEVRRIYRKDQQKTDTVILIYLNKEKAEKAKEIYEDIFHEDIIYINKRLVFA